MALLLTVSLGLFASLPVAAADIVDTAVAADGFQTLVTAVQAANLVDTLKGEGPFTVFAPTDEAFAQLPDGAVSDLLQPENKAQLTDILLYHVVAGTVTSDQITPGNVKTVGGKMVAVKTDMGVQVNGASVIAADVKADNGVIHVIDSVLLP